MVASGQPSTHFTGFKRMPAALNPEALAEYVGGNSGNRLRCQDLPVGEIERRVRAVLENELRRGAYRPESRIVRRGFPGSDLGPGSGDQGAGQGPAPAGGRARPRGCSGGPGPWRLSTAPGKGGAPACPSKGLYPEGRAAPGRPPPPERAARSSPPLGEYPRGRQGLHRCRQAVAGFAVSACGWTDKVGYAQDGYRQAPLEGGPDEQLGGELGEGVAVGARGFEVRGQAGAWRPGRRCPPARRSPGGRRRSTRRSGRGCLPGRRAAGLPGCRRRWPARGRRRMRRRRGRRRGGRMASTFSGQGCEGVGGKPHQRLRQVPGHRLQALRAASRAGRSGAGFRKVARNFRLALRTPSTAPRPAPCFPVIPRDFLRARVRILQEQAGPPMPVQRLFQPPARAGGCPRHGPGQPRRRKSLAAARPPGRPRETRSPRSPGRSVGKSAVPGGQQQGFRSPAQAGSTRAAAAAPSDPAGSGPGPGEWGAGRGRPPLLAARWRRAVSRRAGSPSESDRRWPRSRHPGGSPDRLGPPGKRRAPAPADHPALTALDYRRRGRSRFRQPQPPPVFLPRRQERQLVDRDEPPRHALRRQPGSGEIPQPAGQGSGLQVHLPRNDVSHQLRLAPGAGLGRDAGPPDKRSAARGPPRSPRAPPRNRGS